jgi:hypothetical protein
MMRRLGTILIAVLLYLVASGGVASGAVAAPPAVVGEVAYAAQIYDAPGHDAAPERGPPVNGYATTTYDAVDLRSLGTLASQSGPTSRATYAYDDTRLLVQNDIVAGTTSRSVRAHIADLSLFERLKVAAKTGAELPEGYSSFSAAKRAMGSPGEGNVFDHVVEQSQIKRSGFAPKEIHNPFNMNPVSARTNQIKANYYSSKQPFTGGGTVRDWLTGQSFADQYSFGMDVLTQIRRGLIQ